MGEGGREGGGVYSRVEQPPSEAWQCQYRRQFPVSVALGFPELCGPVTSPASVTVIFSLVFCSENYLNNSHNLTELNPTYLKLSEIK